MSLKALSRAVLHGNQQGNSTETVSFLHGKQERCEVPSGNITATAPLNKKYHAQPLQKLTDEAAKRFAFCEMHREMIEGTCERFNVIEQLKRGDRTAALAGCLLWRLVSAGREIERAGAVDVAPGISVADVLKWVRHEKDIGVIRKDRRALLVCAQSMRAKPMKSWEK